MADNPRTFSEDQADSLLNYASKMTEADPELVPTLASAQTYATVALVEQTRVQNEILARIASALEGLEDRS